MSIVPLKPIETYLGYTANENIYLDLFLRYSADDDDENPITLNSTHFTALFDPKYSQTILFKKKQATDLGIDLKKFIPDKRLKTYNGRTIFSGAAIVDCIIPIMKASELKVRRYYQAIQTIQVIDENVNEQDLTDKCKVIIGRGFLERLRLTVSTGMADTMGACGKKTFTRTSAAEEVEVWNHHIQNLRLYQALQLCGKKLIRGDLDDNEEEDIPLGPNTEREIREQADTSNDNGVRSSINDNGNEDILLGPNTEGVILEQGDTSNDNGIGNGPHDGEGDIPLGSKTEREIREQGEDTSNDTDVRGGLGNEKEKDIRLGSNIKEEMLQQREGKISKSKQKRQRSKKVEQKINEAQYLLSRTIEQSASSRDQVIQLSGLLSQLLSPSSDSVFKQNLIAERFEETQNGLQLRKDI